MRLSLKILLLTIATLPAVGCFGIRYRDPSLSSYEEFTDTTVTLSVSGDPCVTSNCRSTVIVNENMQSMEDSGQVQTARAPLPRFLPAPTQPVFNTRPEYEPPQPMLKLIPVNGSLENQIFEPINRHAAPKLQQIKESDININPIKNQPNRIPLKEELMKPLETQEAAQ
jgi:hypothetical protein